MPYASPSATTTVSSNDHDVNDYSPRLVSRAGGHRRSRSVGDHQLPGAEAPSISQLQAQHANTAAFSPLAGIPRRPRANANTGAQMPVGLKPRGAIFDLRENDVESSGSGSGENSDKPSSPPLPSAIVDGSSSENASDPPPKQSLRVDTSFATRTTPPTPTSNTNDLSQFDGTVAAAAPAIPFPTRSSTDQSNAIPFPAATASSRSNSGTPARSPSSPIIRKSNGSIVKPSLKSSLSSGNIPALASPTQANAANINGNGSRSFTRSAPATPSIKAVHFAEKDGVVVFERSQRPTAVSLGSSAGPPGGLGLSAGEETETETEKENGMMFGNVSSAPSWTKSSSSSSRSEDAYPFPRVARHSASSRLGLGLSGMGAGSSGSTGASGASSSTAGAGGAGSASGASVIVIDKETSSDVPSFPGALSPSLLTSDSRIHLESLSLTTTVSSAPSTPVSPSSPSLSLGATGTERMEEDVLKGTILVENVSFSKSVHIRFTLDDWQTTSEVAATWVASLPTLSAAHTRSRSEPALSARSRSPSPGPNNHSSSPAGRQWDRFAFTINLSSVRHLHTRRLFLVARYIPHEWVGAEFWDNNDGKNYCFVFTRKKGRAAVNATAALLARATNGEDDDDDEEEDDMEKDVVRVVERRSAKPLSPSAATAANVEAQRRKNEEAITSLASRPVPKLPSIGVGKSASAPTLYHQGQMDHEWESKQQYHARLPIHHHGGTHAIHPTQHHSPSPPLASSTPPPPPPSAHSQIGYPSLHLRLSNYVSPSSATPTSPAPSSTSPSISFDNKTTLPQPPLSPPESPVVSRSPAFGPSPPRSPSPLSQEKKQVEVQKPVAVVPAPLTTTRAPVTMTTPPESARSSPTGAAANVPLPLSPPSVPSPPLSTISMKSQSLKPKINTTSGSSSSEDSSDTRKRKILAKNGILSPFSPATTTSPRAWARGATAPHSIDIASRRSALNGGFGGVSVGGFGSPSLMGNGTPSGVPAGAMAPGSVGGSGPAVFFANSNGNGNASHSGPKFEIGGGDGSAASSASSMMDGEHGEHGEHGQAKDTNGNNSPSIFNNAPPEFLQRFCFFGSPAASPSLTSSISPPSFLSPPEHHHPASSSSAHDAHFSNGYASTGATRGSQQLAHAQDGKGLEMDSMHASYVDLPFMYGATAQASIHDNYRPHAHPHAVQH